MSETPCGPAGEPACPGRTLRCPGPGSWDIVGFHDGFTARQAAGAVVGRGVGAHGYVVLVNFLHGLAAHWHHAFVFLEGRGCRERGRLHEGIDRHKTKTRTQEK